MTAKFLIIKEIHGHRSLVTFAILSVLHYSASQAYFPPRGSMFNIRKNYEF